MSPNPLSYQVSFPKTIEAKAARTYRLVEKTQPIYQHHYQTMPNFELPIQKGRDVLHHNLPLVFEDWH